MGQVKVRQLQSHPDLLEGCPGVQTIGLPDAAPQGTSPGSWIGSRAAWTHTSIYTSCWQSVAHFASPSYEWFLLFFFSLSPLGTCLFYTNREHSLSLLVMSLCFLDLWWAQFTEGLSGLTRELLSPLSGHITLSSNLSALMSCYTSFGQQETKWWRFLLLSARRATKETH